MSDKALHLFAVVRKSDGYVKQRVNGYSAAEINVDPDHEVIEMTEELSPGLIRYDRAQSKFVPLPPRPSMHHYWEGDRFVDRATPQERWAQIREARSKLLSVSDWTVVASMERGQQLPQSIRAYRQALRDITKQSDPYNIQWPAPPAELQAMRSEPPISEV